MNTLILIRGLPGSGKSTLAKKMSNYVHYEADMFFEQEGGQYLFDHARIKEAHAWCLNKTYNTLSSGKNVVVSNTFIRLLEMEPYLAMGYPTRIIEAKGSWKSIHSVPQSVMSDMQMRWEIIPLDFTARWSRLKV